MFFSESTLIRVAKNLQSELASIRQSKYAHALRFAESSESSKDFEGLKINPWFRKKEEFDWQLNLDAVFSVESIPELQVENAVGQTNFYKSLEQQAAQIIHELEQKSPDYEEIIRLANAIKDKSSQVPSIISEYYEVELKVSYFEGGNLFINLMSGLGGLVYAPVMALISLFFIPLYLFDYSHYCGGPQFFLDTASYFCESVVNVISSILFPLAMLIAKYETDSINVVKGKLMRCLDSIISLAEAEDAKTLNLGLNEVMLLQ